jgi:hypothetical protein
MLDLLIRPSFLALRPLHMGKLAPTIILLKCVVEAGLQPKKNDISCNWPQGELARPLGVKRPLVSLATYQLRGPHRSFVLVIPNEYDKKLSHTTSGRQCGHIITLDVCIFWVCIMCMQREHATTRDTSKTSNYHFYLKVRRTCTFPLCLELMS